MQKHPFKPRSCRCLSLRPFRPVPGALPLVLREFSSGILPGEGSPTAGALRETVETTDRCPRFQRATERGVSSVRTRPALPSTVTTWPSWRRVVASRTPSTAGMPYSRATMAACDSSPPVSATTAEAEANSGVQAGSVAWQTRTSPGRRRLNPAGGPPRRPRLRHRCR